MLFPSSTEIMLLSLQKGGILAMAQDWGRVHFNRQQKAWCVEGVFQGERHYFSRYQTALGPHTCKTDQEAKLLQLVISSEIANGVFNPLRYKKTKPLHLKAYCEEWLVKVKPTLAWSTFKGYRAAVVHWITPLLGDVFLPDLRYDHYLKLWTGIPRSPKYKKNILTTLYLIMEDARKAGYISQAPDKIVFKGKFTVPVKDLTWIDRDTQERILAELPPEDRAIFQFMFITGVRPSEARALRKKDLYPEKGYITIKKTFSPGPDGEVIKEVKQKRERRIPYYESLEPVLSGLPRSLSPYLFVNVKTGEPYSKNINRDIWDPACVKALGYLVPLNNAGRHSWGNQMSVSGVDMETISAGLGHSNTAITKKHYANPSMEALRKAVNNIRPIKNLYVIRRGDDD
jgi:integrase